MQIYYIICESLLSDLTWKARCPGEFRKGRSILFQIQVHSKEHSSAVSVLF
jgi:hypothetical protein